MRGLLGLVVGVCLLPQAFASSRTLYSSANGNLGFYVENGVGRLFQVEHNRRVWEKKLVQEPDWVLVSNQGVVITFHQRMHAGMAVYNGSGELTGRIAASDALALLGRKAEGKWWTGLDLKVRTIERSSEAQNAALHTSSMYAERRHVMVMRWKNKETYVDLFEARMMSAKEIEAQASSANALRSIGNNGK